MKTNLTKHFLTMVLSAALLPGAMAAEKTAMDVQSVFVQKGLVLAIVDGQQVELTNEITFPKDIIIYTNGTFKVAGSKERSLGEGQVLTPDGMLTSPDGTIVPVEDHLTSQGGRVFLVKDGESLPLSGTFTLKNGTRVSPDGKMMTSRNVFKRLLDGQVIRLNEAMVEATDTAQLESGKVVLYKDGGRIELRPGQVMAMSDGSRVNGNGTVTMKNGTTVSLKEGELLKFAGAGDNR
ncbi:MAG TPA: DUF6799 domain-containing protein [Verrucomicrobiae bacterium]|nr:DUF6799 domain-containing protein [Verrucomicrobiae bacterium]